MTTGIAILITVLIIAAMIGIFDARNDSKRMRVFVYCVEAFLALCVVVVWGWSWVALLVFAIWRLVS